MHVVLPYFVNHLENILNFNSRDFGRNRWNSFNDNPRPSFLEAPDSDSSSNEPVQSYSEVRTCAEWINVNVRSIWKEGYADYVVDHGHIEPEAFCELFGEHLRRVYFYISPHETYLTCREWIHTVGYLSYEDGIQENVLIAESRELVNLDKYISDWPVAYAKFLIDGGLANLTPSKYCSQWLNLNDQPLLAKLQTFIL